MSTITIINMIKLRQTADETIQIEKELTPVDFCTLRYLAIFNTKLAGDHVSFEESLTLALSRLQGLKSHLKELFIMLPKAISPGETELYQLTMK